MVGIDEAGRGSLAGSMFLVGVKTPSEIHIQRLKELGLNDSKKLSPKKRMKIYNYIIKKVNYKICKFTACIIDKEGLSGCYKKGLTEIYTYFKNEEIIFDGNTLYGLNLPIKTETKADAKYLEVSLASVIAKVERDLEIEEIAKQYPQYLWNKHNGYPQKIHTEMIKEFGILKGIHRESWKNIKKIKEEKCQLF